MKRLSCDVLVVGQGAAGIRAALAAAAGGAGVLLAGEGPVGASGSTFYPRSPEWGIQYAESDADVEAFLSDILRVADGCLNPALARIMAERSRAAVAGLAAMGMRFLPLGSLGLEGCFTGKGRGALLLDLEEAAAAFRRALQSAPGLQRRDDLYVADLLVENNACVGAVAVTAGGELVLVDAGAVVLACGGAQALYQYAYSHGGMHGAGYAMAARAGARLVNLEYVQFIPAALSPVAGLNYYQFALAEHPQVRNARAEPFLEQYLPPGLDEARCLTLRAGHGPFSVEDDSRYFDLAMLYEARRGHGVGVDILPDPTRLQSPRYSRWRAFLRGQGLDESAAMRVYPHAHASNGGVLIGEDAGADLPGLFACGEVAGGMHGPNRIGGNAMLATQVFGALAGGSAAQYARESGRTAFSASSALELLHRAFPAGDTPAGNVLAQVREEMQAHAFLERDRAGLSGALRRLERLSPVSPLAVRGAPSARARFVACNALLAARLTLAAMLGRCESRGGHNRTDSPTHMPGGERMQALLLRDGAPHAAPLADNTHYGRTG